MGLGWCRPEPGGSRCPFTHFSLHWSPLCTWAAKGLSLTRPFSVASCLSRPWQASNSAHAGTVTAASFATDQIARDSLFMGLVLRGRHVTRSGQGPARPSRVLPPPARRRFAATGSGLRARQRAAPSAEKPQARFRCMSAGHLRCAAIGACQARPQWPRMLLRRDQGWRAADARAARAGRCPLSTPSRRPSRRHALPSHSHSQPQGARRPAVQTSRRAAETPRLGRPRPWLPALVPRRRAQTQRKRREWR
mmetsp:Transcript_12589/g.32115  ORF Transcript_12589/g.32115 Transcript_12589/m.32115 type:complete len:250 (-) Transcript_12589:67-816(-)